MSNSFEWHDTGDRHLLVSKDGETVGIINIDRLGAWGWAEGDNDHRGSRRLVHADDINTIKATVAERAAAVAEAAALRRERARYCGCGATIRHDEWTGERWCPNCG